MPHKESEFHKCSVFIINWVKTAKVDLYVPMPIIYILALRNHSCSQKTCRILNVSRLSRSLKAYIFSFGSLDQSVGCIYENKLGILNTELFYDICPRYIVNQKSSVLLTIVRRIQKLETAGTNPKVLYLLPGI